VHGELKQLPAVVISGFLGAGKTTLLNRLLAHGLAGKKAGVIVNDFGKLNVDGRLVRKGEHPLLELSNGCVCCSLQTGLSTAVRTLAARGDLDLLVIEASGISVSSALLHALTSPELAERIRLSKVVAVVDARRYAQVLHALPVIRDQVARANLIVLNHCDEVDAVTIEASKGRLRQENPDAPIVVAEHGNVSFDTLLANVTSAERFEHPLQHDGQWHSYEIELPDDFDPNQLLAMADRLPNAVERVKGFVACGTELHVLQKVGPFPASLERWAGESLTEARNTLVVIAREPVAAELGRIFADCRVVAATSARSPHP
jgi:G3E family GTPase